MEQGAGYRWLLVIVLATMVNVGYGAIFYAFSVLLGEDAAAREFSRTVLSASLSLGIIVSGAFALLVGTLCDVVGSRRVFLAGAMLGSAGLAAFSRAIEEWQVVAAWDAFAGSGDGLHLLRAGVRRDRPVVRGTAGKTLGGADGGGGIFGDDLYTADPVAG
jgi:MFS family permease